MTLDELLAKMWKDYTQMNPGAQKIVDLLQSEGEQVVNDHIALRTFDHPRINVDVLAKPFLESGYVEAGDYVFEEKKLYAKHYEHPDENKPKIFISQLETSKFSPRLQQLVSKIVDQLDDETIKRFDFSSVGRPWNISSEEYKALDQESEYAGWVAAIGFRPNHFIIFINKLGKLNDIVKLNQFLKDHGFKLNSSGGEIKGSKDVYLEQSSTMADQIKVDFSDTSLTIPSCYFEFAKRYPLENGKLYQGFVAKSADKIFESTNKH